MIESGESASVFESIGLMKVAAASSLGLSGDDLTAAVTAAPAFPSVLRTLADAVPRHAAATIVDLGAGLGGASTWLATETGARVIAVEPSAGSRRAAGELFPDLDIRSGTAQRSGLPDDIADAVVLLGVISLVRDLGEVLDEVRRLLRDGGIVGIADIFVDDETGEDTGVNVLRSIPSVSAQLRAGGYEVTAVGCASDATASDSWASLSAQLKERVLRDHAHEPEMSAWIDDQQQIASWIDDDHIFGACIVARPLPDPKDV